MYLEEGNDSLVLAVGGVLAEAARQRLVHVELGREEVRGGVAAGRGTAAAAAATGESPLALLGIALLHVALYETVNRGRFRGFAIEAMVMMMGQFRRDTGPSCGNWRALAALGALGQRTQLGGTLESAGTLLARRRARAIGIGALGIERGKVSRRRASRGRVNRGTNLQLLLPLLGAFVRRELRVRPVLMANLLELFRVGFRAEGGPARKTSS